MNLFLASDSRKAAFLSSVSQLKTQHFAAIECFSDVEIAAMIAQSETLSFRKAREVAGNNIHQDFDICFPAPLTGHFSDCAKMLEMLVADAALTLPNLCEGSFVINDFAIQKYPKASKGIGIHKDSTKYRNFVFIITLAGTSELFICLDRQGSNAVVIDDRPGRLVILPAPGFYGLENEADRPLHGVRHVTEGRLSLGFRQEMAIAI